MSHTKKQPIAVTDQYIALIKAQDRHDVSDYALYLLEQVRTSWTKQAIADCWIEAVVQKLLGAGLLRPIELIKQERGIK